MSRFGPIVTPDEVLELLLAVAENDTVRQEHLNVLERAKGLQPRTIPDFVTVGRLGEEGEREAQDWAPSLQMFLAGTSDRPELNENRQLDFRWDVAVEVQYLGISRTDAIRGAWWYAMVAAQLLLQRTPRDGLIQRLLIKDMEALPDGRSDRLHGVRFIVEAHVTDMLALNGAAPLGSADLPADPYAPPGSWPAFTKTVAVVDKEPLQ